MEALRKTLTQEVEKYKALQKDFQKAYSLRHKLDTQLNENTVVKEELALLGANAGVYKLIGPVLVKQDHEEAIENVDKRLEYISTELKRHDSLLGELEKKQDAQRDIIRKLEKQIQQSKTK